MMCEEFTMILKKGLSARHKAAADLMICCPALRQGQIADLVGVTQAWLSTVKGTVVFREHLISRRRELVDDILALPPQHRAAAILRAYGLPEYGTGLHICDPETGLEVTIVEPAQRATQRGYAQQWPA
jgi:hypothetical protein